MQIERFRVRDYKSIIDSGDCYLTDTITILAGKNESGKTSILEALEDFDTEKSIEDKAKPIQRQDAIPAITVAFRFEKKELREVFDKLKLKPTQKGSFLIEITKTFPKQYRLSDHSLTVLGISDGNKFNQLKKTD